MIPELVQRIDYKKGTYFADEGDFASAGAAHIWLADRLPQGLASASLGSDGYMRDVLADSFQAANGVLLYGLQLNRNNGPWELPERVRKIRGRTALQPGNAGGWLQRHRRGVSQHLEFHGSDSAACG